MHPLTTTRRTLFLLVLLAADPAGGASPKSTLKFATLAPEGSAWMQAFDQVRQDVLEATGGDVVIRVYPAGVLGEEKDVLYKMKVGQVDGGAFIGYGISRICPEANALMFPLLFDTYEEVDVVFAAMQSHLDAESLRNGYVALGWTEVGFSYLYSTRPVRTLAELRGAKPWMTPGEHLIAEVFTAGRINAIPVAVADVLTALQTGLIQTIYAPPVATVAMQWHTRVRYRNDLRLVYSFGGVFVTERSWKALPAERRPVILEIFRRRTRELTEKVRALDAEALRVMAGQGIETVTSPPEEVAEFRAISREALRKVEGRMFSREAAERVRHHLETFRARPPEDRDAP